MRAYGVWNLPSMKRVVFDCDPSVDDALALVLALNSGRVALEGITAVAGNASVSKTTRNACRLLDYFDVDVPVSRGASRPLRATPVREAGIHGKDGLGDSPLLARDSSRKIEPMDAADFITKSVESGVGTVVATGPLTNVALAFQRNARAMGGLKELIIMGGAIHVPGNIDSRSEFNFYADPDAADFVLRRTGVRKVLVPLDASHQVVLSSADVAEMSDSKSGRLVKSVSAGYRRGYAEAGYAGAPLHDPLAMGGCIDETFLKLSPMFVRVEASGTYTRGTCVPEERSGENRRPNVNVALGVDSERFLDYFKRTVSK